MRTCTWLLAAAVTLGGALALYSAPAPTKADPERIEKLIRQLGSDQFTDREQATKDLEAIGAAALPALEKASQSGDAETSKRARQLVEKLANAAESERLLKPTQVRLVYKDTPIAEAVADFAKKTGVEIILVDAAKLKDRTVTLDTGDTTFWQAYDQFCAKAGLTEAVAQPIGRPLPRPVPLPIQIQPLPAPAPRVPPQKQNNGAGQGQGFQVQVQPAQAQPAQAQAQPIQVQVQPALRVARPFPANIPGQLQLADGKPAALPTCYSGSVRIRALPAGNEVGAKDGEIPLLLEVAAEPRMQMINLVGVRIDKAVDDRGQSLLQQVADANEEAPGNVVINAVAGKAAFVAVRPGFQNQAVQKTGVRLKKGENPSKTIKELSGTVTAQVRTAPEALITVENVLKAAGMTAKGQRSGSIKVIEATEDAKGQVKVRIQFEAPQEAAQGPLNGAGIAVNVVAQAQVQVQVQVGGQVQIKALPAIGRVGFDVGGNFAMIDAQGAELPLIGMANVGRAAGNNVQIEHVLTFQAKKGQADGAKLVYRASRTINLDVPFTLKDVPVQ